MKPIRARRSAAVDALKRLPAESRRGQPAQWDALRPSLRDKAFKGEF